ncbi:MAG TPA: DUF433 domain-containing protein [Aggregatilineales bacterium]|nr:DUF433 domain-containing protein [Aggregatilineales bacterium]
MNLVIQAPPVPLEIKEDGVVRVTGSRVTLDTVVGAFNEGASAEEIVEQYPSLALTDVYAVLNYYLHEKQTVDVYLSEYRQRGEQIRREVEARFSPVGIRERLLARRAKHGRWRCIRFSMKTLTMSFCGDCCATIRIWISFECRM